jgi:toxin HigB-1
MIKSFNHKGLQTFFETGSKKGIVPGHSNKLARVLDRLDVSLTPTDMNLPGFKLHKMTGKEEGTWSVWVNGNWRVTFQFERENIILVDYRDYH